MKNTLGWKSMGSAGACNICDREWKHKKERKEGK